MKENERKYHRAQVLELPDVLNKIKEVEDKEHRYKVNIGGYRVNVSSNRLKTFIQSQECPCCHVKASFFAIEKQTKKYLSNTESKKGYHLNLYGLDKDKNEILFTHDHTLARGLGGKDALDNTVTMCSPCNAHKGQLESRIKNTKSLKYKEILQEEIEKFLSTGIKKTPEHPEPHVDQKPESKAYLKKLMENEIKRIYKKRAKNPESLTEEEKKILDEREKIKLEIQERINEQNNKPFRTFKY